MEKGHIIEKLRQVEAEKKAGEAQRRVEMLQHKVEEERDWAFARALIRKWIPPLNGRVDHFHRLHVLKRREAEKDHYRVSTSGKDYSRFNQADWQAFEVSFATRHYKFRGSDESPEQDCSDRAIIIKWWRRGYRGDDQEMGDGVEIKRFDKDQADKTDKEFQDKILERLRYITNLQ